MESKTDEKRAYFREQSLNELMYTEKQYVEDLEFIISHFLEPLRDQKILNKLELKAIFSTVEVIIKINKILYEQLNERLSKDTNFEEILLGDIFLKLADFLKVYTTYIGDQEGCISTFQNCKTTNKQFAAFLKECGRNPDYRGLDLVSYLIKPVQRICKYPLLLRQIVAYTPETAADYEVMKQVLNKFEEVTVYANEHKRRMEKQNAMVQTSKMIVNSFTKFPQLITPSRYFVRSWEWVRISQSGRIKDVQIFLFNDLIVETSRKKKNGEYVQRAQIAISGLQVKDHPDTSKFKNLLEIRRKDGKMFVYSSTSRQDLEQWREAIQQQINEITNIEKDLTRHCSKSEISRRNPLSLSISGMSSSSSSPSSPSREKHVKNNDLSQSFSLPTKNFLGTLEECYSDEDVEDDSYDETDDETIDQDII